MVNNNGILSSSTEANFHFTERAVQYGDTLFETVKAVHGKLLFWEDHYFRLMASMRILRMEIPLEFTPEYLETQLQETIKACGFEERSCVIKLMVFRKGDASYSSIKNEVGFMVSIPDFIDKTPQEFERIEIPPFYTLSTRSYEVELFKDHYVNADLLSTINTAQRTIHILGSIYAKENGYTSCLLLNNKKNVVQGIDGNLFVIKDNYIKTPSLEEGCIRGILRKQLADIVSITDGWIYEEAPISPFELQKADELFLADVTYGIQPITKYRKKHFTTEITAQLLQKLNIKARLG